MQWTALGSIDDAVFLPLFRHSTSEIVSRGSATAARCALTLHCSAAEEFIWLLLIRSKGVVAKQRSWSLGEDLKIEPQRPVAHILQVEAHHIVKAHPAASLDLP